MTTIAWDGKTVAADSLKTIRDGFERRAGSFQKIKRVGDIVYAITGSAALFDPLIEWHKEGAFRNKMPKDKHDGYSALLVFSEGRCFCYTTDIGYPEELFAPDAFGSGSDYALGALHAGVDAARAVQVAMICNPQTGGEIQVVDLTFQKASIKNPVNGGKKKTTPRDLTAITDRAA